MKRKQRSQKKQNRKNKSKNEIREDDVMMETLEYTVQLSSGKYRRRITITPEPEPCSPEPTGEGRLSSLYLFP
jgi:hypothetical protein